MSYIIKKSSPLVNVKLTDTGRKSMANGNLSFSGYSLGDSEVDYTTDDTSLELVLRPVDNNPDIMYPVAAQGSNYIVPITNLTAIPQVLSQTATERGLFGPYTTTNREVLKTATPQNEFGIENVNGMQMDLVLKSGSVVEMGVGWFVLIKVGYGATPLYSTFFNTAQTVLMFQVTQVVATASTRVTVIVDRTLPKFASFANSVAYTYRDTTLTSLDHPDPSTYWDESVLNFTLNGVTTYDDVKIWNFNLVLLEDMMGVDPTKDKNLTQTKGKRMLGTSVLFKYYEEAKLDKIGVVHYTNNSVSNWYGEGFYQNTFALDLPHIMWHKKQSGGSGLGADIGYTFVCDSEPKTLYGKVKYYDLVDQEVNPTVVGKVFVDYKICVVEHPELLMVMSIKGNRNWTLPKPKLTGITPGACNGASTTGAVLEGEALHVSYVFYDTVGVTPVHCNDYTTIALPVGGSETARDVIFELPKDATNPLYSELGYMKNYDDASNLGFKANRAALIWQKTDAGYRPTPQEWKVVDISNYLGTTGCIDTNVNIFDDFYLETDTVLTPISGYTLSHPAIGEVILASNGNVKTEADDFASMTSSKPFWHDKTANKIYFHSSIQNVVSQIYYLSGETVTSSTRIQKYSTPSPIPSDTFTGLYVDSSTNKVCVHLDYQPSNEVVYLFYNGQLVSSNNYSVYNTGVLNQRRVELSFIPATGSKVMVYYIDAAFTGINPQSSALTVNNFNNLRVFIDKGFLDNSSDSPYNLRDFVSIPAITNDTEVTFGDEEMLLGNVRTDIKATIYKSVITCDVLPNQFVRSTNPTWNANTDKVQYSEIGIYDQNNDMVAVGKFSQPLARKYNSDVLVIQATIDF